jgi:hypothetical protein
MQSVPIITNVVNLNPACGEVYSLQLYSKKFVSDMQQVGVFLCVLWFPPPIKLQQYFSYIVAISFIGGGNQSTQRKTPTCCMSLTNFFE